MFNRNKQAVARNDIQPMLSKKLILRGVFVLGIAGLTFWLINMKSNDALFPIETIRAQGSFVHVTEKMLHEAIKDADGQGFFTVDVAEIKIRVESLPWVKQASVKRVWPGTLNIAVQERQAVAQLVQGGLVDTAGEIFHPQQNSYPENMVIFDVSSMQVKQCLNYYYDSIAMLNKIG